MDRDWLDRSRRGKRGYDELECGDDRYRDGDMRLRLEREREAARRGQRERVEEEARRRDEERREEERLRAQIRPPPYVRGRE